MTQAGTYPLLDRRGPDNLGRMVWMSLGVHVLLAVLLFVVPRDWFARREPDVMKITIALGGGAEKTAGGLTSAGSRPVQEVAPPPKRPVPVQPAAPPKAAASATVTKPVTKPYIPTLPDAVPNPKPPTTGAKVSPGTSPAETRVLGSNASGLSFASGGGGVQSLDDSFCCPEWAAELRRRIMANWEQNQGEAGVTEIVFVVRKDGSFSAPEVAKSSGIVLLDVASKAVFNKDRLRLEPLPSKYPGETLRVRLAFEYKR